MQNITYYKKNKDMLLQKSRAYYEKNKDMLLQKSKDYYEKNKEQREEYRKNKYNNMKEEERLNALKYRIDWYHKLDVERKRKIRNYSKTVSHPNEIN